MPTQQDQLDRQGGKIRNDIVKLHANFRCVRYVSNHKPREARQRFNCFRHIPASWDREVKQDWQQITIAQFITQRVEDCLTLIREATENQHHLGSNGVDHVTDFLVMKQEVDELRDLNVIDGNLRLCIFCDDQVLLLGPFQFQIPSGYAVDATAGEISARKVGVYQ